MSLAPGSKLGVYEIVEKIGPEAWAKSTGRAILAWAGT